MPAITQSHISAHADYHRSDYMFPRVQSRALSLLEWERRAPRLHAWGGLLIPALTAAAVIVAALAAFH